MSRNSLFVVVGAVAVVGVLSAGCSPQPSAETAALEPYLLTLDDVGDGFTEQRGGQVTYDIGHLCPGTEISIGQVGAVKADFVKPSGGHEISVTQHIWTDSPDLIDAYMTNLKTAFEECDGVAWEYYGETSVRVIMDPPAVGDDRIAVHEWSPDDESDVVDWRTVFVRRGDIVASVTVAEGRADWTAPRAMTDEEFYAIVSDAIDKLPD
jgi:hypothetical protein